MNAQDMQVGIENTTKKNHGVSHLESVALRLLVLAQKDEAFKKRLMQYLFDSDLISPEIIENSEDVFGYEHIEWIPFIHPGIAERKLIWLSNEIEHASDDQRQKVIKILSFVYRNNMPKMAAWGIVFVETLGVFVAGHPFEVKSSLEYSQVIILGPNWRQIEPQNLTKKISKISLMTLTRCIEEAEFNLKRLEPEVSSWLFEGSGLELYSAKNEEDFKEVLVHVRNCGLPFTSLSDEIDLIALQPCVTGSYETLLPELTLV